MLRPAFFILIVFLFIAARFKELQKFQISGFAQGTTYHITYYANDSLIKKFQIDSLLDQIDSSLSLYKPYSLVNRFNNSKTGLIVDQHFRKVVNKAIETWKLTGGLFDITIFPLTNAWGFGPVRPPNPPDEKTIRQLVKCIGSNALSWKGNRLIKSKACIQLDPNGIAQGYAVDVLADFLEKNGIVNYLVELGGELRVQGRKPDNEMMTIGIESPASEFDFSIISRVVHLDHGAITTSGSYRRYYESGGKAITHLINPKTGYTLRNELLSVTVFAKDAITADAFDNALMLMGLEKAMTFVEKRTDLAAHFIYHRKDGGIADTATSRFLPLLKP